MENLESFNKYMDSLSHTMQAKAEQHATHPPQFVTISRETGAGGFTVASKLAAYLAERDPSAERPWTALDKQLVQKTLEEHRLPDKFAQFMKEDAVSEVQDAMEELFGLHPSQWTLVQRTSQTILHLAMMGNVVLLGRASNIVTGRLPGGVHVRMIAPLDRRIAHAQEMHGLSRSDAGRFVREEDAAREHYVKKNFGRSADDEHLYDLVLNTGSLSYDEAARIIGELVLGRRRGAPVHAS